MRKILVAKLTLAALVGGYLAAMLLLARADPAEGGAMQVLAAFGGGPYAPDGGGGPLLLGRAFGSLPPLQ